MKKTLFLISFTTMISTLAYGGAMDNFTQSGRGIAMGGAMTGLANDAAAVYYNPAGLAMLADEKNQLELYSSFGSTTAKVLPTGAEYKSSTLAIVPGLLAARKTGNLGFGLGVTIPYGGGGVKYADFPIPGSNFESALGIVAVTPAFAYQLSPMLSLGAGISAYYGTMTSKSDSVFMIPFVGLQTMTIETSYAGIGGFGGNIGALLKPTENLGIGVNVRIPTAIKLDGKVKSGTIERDSTLEFNLPTYVNAGLSLRLIPQLSTTLDVWYMGYATTDKFTMTTAGTAAETKTYYKNCMNLALGLEYKISDPLAARAGVIYVQNGTENEGLSLGNPDVDKTVLSLGAGYTIDVVTLNVAAMFVFGSAREYNGATFDSDSNVLTVGLAFAF